MDWVLILFLVGAVLGFAAALFERSMVGAAVAFISLAFFVQRV